MTTDVSQPDLPEHDPWRFASPPDCKAVGLVLLCAVVYWPTLRNGFVTDDSIYVQGNVALRSLGGLLDIWFKLGTIEQYYPLVHTSFWVEHQLWQLNPLGYHVVNLLLHAIAVLLAWRLLVVLEVPGAWLAAALFAVHPVGVETVAWVAERKNLLSCVCALGSLLAYWRFTALTVAADDSLDESDDNTRWWWYGLALVLFVAALLSKTVTVTLPAVVLVLLWWKQGGLAKRDWLRLAPFFGIGLVLSALAIYMEKTFVGATGDEWDLPLAGRCLIAGRALFFYAGKLCWPMPLRYYYPRWVIDTGVWWQYLFPLAAAALILALWFARGRIGRGPLAAVLIFAIVLSPALGFFDVYPFRFSFVADHYQYHACIALFALAAAAIAQVAARAGTRSNSVLMLASLVLLLPLAVLARQRTFVFQNNLTVDADIVLLNAQPETAVLAVCADQQRAYQNLGERARGQGELETALAQFQKALAFRQRLARDGTETDKYRDLVAAGFVDVGTLQSRLDRLPDADVSFRQAIEIRQELANQDATNIDSRRRLAATYEDAAAACDASNRMADAETFHLAAIELRQSLVSGDTASVDDLSALAADCEKLGLLQQNLGRPADAVASWRRALEIRQLVAREYPAVFPDSIPWILTHLAILQRGAGQTGEAIALGEQSVKLLEGLVATEPAREQFRLNLGWSCANLALSQQAAGQLEAAASAFRRSAEVRKQLANDFPANPRYPSELAATYIDLGLLERDLGRTPAAEEAFAEAVQVRRKLVGNAVSNASTMMDRQPWTSLADCYELLAPMQRQNGRSGEADNSEREAAAIRANLAKQGSLPQ